MNFYTRVKVFFPSSSPSHQTHSPHFPTQIKPLNTAAHSMDLLHLIYHNRRCHLDIRPPLSSLLLNSSHTFSELAVSNELSDLFYQWKQWVMKTPVTDALIVCGDGGEEEKRNKLPPGSSADKNKCRFLLGFDQVTCSHGHFFIMSTIPAPLPLRANYPKNTSFHSKH